MRKLQEWATKLRALAEHPGTPRDEAAAARNRLDVIETKIRELDVSCGVDAAKHRDWAHQASKIEEDLDQINADDRSKFIDQWLRQSRFSHNGESRKKEVYERLRRYLDLGVSYIAEAMINEDGRLVFPEKFASHHLIQALDALEEMLYYLESQHWRRSALEASTTGKRDDIVQTGNLLSKSDFRDRLLIETRVKVNLVREEVMARREQRRRRFSHEREALALKNGV